MFEKASRLKLRFDVQGGQASVEDLWDLPLTGKRVNLDNMAKELNKAIKDSEEESFVVKRSKANEELQLKFDIVKHVISTKLSERETIRQAGKRKLEVEKLDELIARKQDKQKEELTVDELLQQRDAILKGL
jgi:hypothetical protein